MPVYTFVGPKWQKDWRIEQIKVENVDGEVVILQRGDSADIPDWQYDQLESRYKLEPGAVSPDPLVDPDEGAQGPKGDPGDPGQGFSVPEAWAPNTQYALFDIITYNGRTYTPSVAFQSGAQFSATNLTLLADKGNSQIAYAERTSQVLVANHVANTSYDITDLSITVTADGVHPIMLEAWLSAVVVSGGTPDVRVWIVEGANIIQAASKRQVAANIATGEYKLERELIPTAGNHTYKAIMRSTAGGAGISIYANADPTFPAFIRAIEV